MSQKSYDQTPTLFLIPTPIGNLEDMSIRCLKTLQEVDYILCEDTRTTGNLLKKYELRKPLVSCHEFNENQVKEKVVKDLKKGLNLGLVTDQGTPIISDPGYKVVEEVLRNGLNVVSLPGPTAFVPALINSGISPAPFLFYGFLNSKGGKQIKELEQLKLRKETLIFYEAPHRIQKTLEQMQTILGDRKISVSREISKIHEEIYRGPISKVRLEITNPKGEFVIVVSGNLELENYEEISIIEHVQLYLDENMTEKEAIKKVAQERNLSKSIVYKEYHQSKEVRK